MTTGAFSLRRTLAVGALVLASPMVWASGSISFGGAGGGAGDVTQQYNQGKQIVYQKIVCKTCSQAGQTVDRAFAKKLLADSSVSPGLSSAEQSAVRVYLQRRFRI
jgi:hypothetical protein